MSIGKKKIFFVVSGLFFLIGILCLSLLLNSYLNIKPIKKNNLDNGKMFENLAIMVEKEDGSGYEEVNDIPTDMTLNTNLSNCKNKSGITINSDIVYSDGVVTVDTDSTIYCYLYFDRAGDTEVPIVTASLSGKNISFSSSESGTYCINMSSESTNFSNCVDSGNVETNLTILASGFDTSGTYYVHVKDNAGNIGISSGVLVTVTSNQFGEYLLNNPPTGLTTSTAYNGLYRFIGTSANNYVKLNDVLYRIIGITESSTTNKGLGLEYGQVKLIKTESVGNYNWHTSYSSNTIWTESAMYDYLQGSSILGSATVIPSSWTNKIDSVNWYIGDVNTTSTTDASTVLGYEDDTTSNIQFKVGLISFTDYAYAYNVGGTQNCRNGCSSWLTNTSAKTWSMTRYGYYGKYYNAWAFDTSGYATLTTTTLTNSYAVQPVFYLLPDVVYKSGSGQSGDPFIIE